MSSGESRRKLDYVTGLIEERHKAVTVADADMQALLSKAFETRPLRALLDAQ